MKHLVMCTSTWIIWKLDFRLMSVLYWFHIETFILLNSRVSWMWGDFWMDVQVSRFLDKRPYNFSRYRNLGGRPVRQKIFYK